MLRACLRGPLFYSGARLRYFEQAKQKDCMDEEGEVPLMYRIFYVFQKKGGLDAILADENRTRKLFHR